MWDVGLQLSTVSGVRHTSNCGKIKWFCLFGTVTYNTSLTDMHSVGLLAFELRQLFHRYVNT